MNRGDLYSGIRTGNIGALKRARKLADGLQQAHEWGEFDPSMLAMLEAAQEEAEQLATALHELNAWTKKSIASLREEAAAADKKGSGGV